WVLLSWLWPLQWPALDTGLPHPCTHSALPASPNLFAWFHSYLHPVLGLHLGRYAAARTLNFAKGRPHSKIASENARQNSRALTTVYGISQGVYSNCRMMKGDISPANCTTVSVSCSLG